jgi:hypothetical protein
MNKHNLHIVFLFFFSASLTAQTASLSIGEKAGCADQEVLLPVMAYDFYNVNAITIFIGFDTTVLRFESVTNVDPQIIGCSWNLMLNPVQLGFVWSGVTPLNLTQKKLFDLRFTLIDGSTSVYFKSECEFVDGSLQVIPVNLLNGSIFDHTVSLDINPQDTTVNSGTNASFTVTSINALNYKWEVSSNSGIDWSVIQDGTYYLGTHSSRLDVIQPPLSFDNNRYLCTIDNGFCEVSSSSARLQVDSMLAIIDHSLQTINLSQNLPNPFSLETEIRYFLPQQGSVKLHIYNYSGIEVLSLSGQLQPAGQHSMILNAPELSSGLYFYNLEVTDQGGLHSAFKTMIKH